MKTVKSLLLGSAAGIAALTGAQAADLPMAEPVQYVRVCDTFGAGFFFIPGTETCLRIGGSGAAQARFLPGVSDSRATNDPFAYRASAIFTFDARTKSDYGTVRSFLSFRSYVQSQNSQVANPTNNWGSGGALPATHEGSPFTTAETYVNGAFVQFAGFTAGMAPSFYDASAYATLGLGPISSSQTTLLTAYTATLGTGLTATLAAEDRAYREIQTFSGAPNATPGSIGGNLGAASPGTPYYYINAPTSSSPMGQYTTAAMPDITANVRIDQGWGFFQLSGAVHQLRTAGFSANIGGTAGTAGSGTTYTTGNDTDYGFAVQGSLKINIPALAAGDFIFVNGAYADGAVAYLDSYTTLFPFQGRTAAAGGAGLPGIAVADQWLVGTPGASSLDKSEGYNIAAGIIHYWTPSLRSGLAGHYFHLDQAGGPTATVAGVGGTRIAGANWTYSQVNVTHDLVWSPVKDLDLGLAVIYSNVFDTNLPAGYRQGDLERWGAIAQVERRF